MLTEISRPLRRKQTIERKVGEERKATEREYIGKAPERKKQRGTSKVPVTFLDPVGPSLTNLIKSGI